LNRSPFSQPKPFQAAREMDCPSPRSKPLRSTCCHACQGDHVHGALVQIVVRVHHVINHVVLLFLDGIQLIGKLNPGDVHHFHVKNKSVPFFLSFKC
jgi:hypothetical protein